MAGKLTWYGPQVAARVRAAATAALEETTQRAADQARSTTWRGAEPRRHPDEPHAADTLYAAEVERSGSRLIARWGSWLWRYIFIETGVGGRSGGHFLRRAADTEYPNLPDRIRSRLR